MCGSLKLKNKNNKRAVGEKRLLVGSRDQAPEGLSQKPKPALRGRRLRLLVNILRMGCFQKLPSPYPPTHTHTNSPKICSFLALSKHSCCDCNLPRGFCHYSNNLAADVGRVVWREQKAPCSLCMEGGHRELATQDTEYRSIESPCECAEPVLPKEVEETEAPNND